MARPAVYDDALRERLLITTAEMVIAKGAGRLSLRDIAQAAGTSTSAIYALFGGKAELLAAVINHGFASFAADQAAVASHGLRALGVAYRAWALANPALYRLMFGGSITAETEDCVPSSEVADSAMDPLLHVLAPRVRPDELEGAAMAVWAHVHGAVSLELARVVPESIGGDATYDAVLDAIERAYPRP